MSRTGLMCYTHSQARWLNHYNLSLTTVKATKFDISIPVVGAAVKLHRTQPTWDEEDISRVQKHSVSLLPREVVTSPLCNGEVLLGTSL